MSNIELYNGLEKGLKVYDKLQVQDIQLNKNLSKDSKQVILASNCYPKIKERGSELFPSGHENAGKEIRQFEIRQHINSAILSSGYGASLNEEDIRILIEDVIIDVLKDFSHLTTIEVGIAFRNGSREVYGEYMGISTRLFYKWLRHYCQETKLKANKELLKLNNTKAIEKVVDKEKIKQEWLNSIN